MLTLADVPVTRRFPFERIGLHATLGHAGPGDRRCRPCLAVSPGGSAQLSLSTPSPFGSSPLAWSGRPARSYYLLLIPGPTSLARSIAGSCTVSPTAGAWLPFAMGAPAAAGMLTAQFDGLQLRPAKAPLPHAEALPGLLREVSCPLPMSERAIGGCRLTVMPHRFPGERRTTEAQGCDTPLALPRSQVQPEPI